MFKVNKDTRTTPFYAIFFLGQKFLFVFFYKVQVIKVLTVCDLGFRYAKYWPILTHDQYWPMKIY